MTLNQMIGWLLIASPFVGLAVFSGVMLGPLATLLIFATTAVICGVVAAGVHLANS